MNKKTTVEKLNELYNKLDVEIMAVAGFSRHMSPDEIRYYLIPTVRKLESCLLMLEKINHSIEREVQDD